MQQQVRVWYGTADIDADLGPTVVTIGNFDGVHRGHQYVIGRAREEAAATGGATPLPVVAVTFDPHPMTVIRPDKAPAALTTIEQRTRLLGDAGADAVLVLHFTSELADLPAEEFATGILYGALHARVIVVGENFRFGHRALGDCDLLRALAPTYGAEVKALRLDGSGQQVWSSTYIRQQLLNGDVAAAATALGRPFTVTGEVARGYRRGRDLLGFPTANVPVADDSPMLVPGDGVYAGWLRPVDAPDADPYPAAISVGSNPTFPGVARTIEAYVLDRKDLQLYGVTIEISFVQRLRPMEKYDSAQTLADQMQADVDRARNLLR